MRRNPLQSMHMGRHHDLNKGIDYTQISILAKRWGSLEQQKDLTRSKHKLWKNHEHLRSQAVANLLSLLLRVHTMGNGMCSCALASQRARGSSYIGPDPAIWLQGRGRPPNPLSFLKATWSQAFDDCFEKRSNSISKHSIQ